MAAPRAAGILFVNAGRVLLLKRSEEAKDAPGTWGFPGGGIEAGETPEAAARRELQEECGYAYTGPLTPLCTLSNGFECFGAALATPFTPKLNDEHTAASWAPFDKLPSPLHPGMNELAKLRETKTLAEDGAPCDVPSTLAALWRIISHFEGGARDDLRSPQRDLLPAR